MIAAARERLIFALDVDSFEEAQKWVKQLHTRVGLFKVGKQLFLGRIFGQLDVRASSLVLHRRGRITVGT